MDIYQPTLDYISNLPILKIWTEAKSLLDHAASLRPRDWRLPALACEAVGGEPEEAVPACAALACAQISIILVDDMLDEDPRGEYHRLGAAQTANLAGTFLSAASQAILHSAARPSIKLAGVQDLNLMITSVAFGQYLDVQNPVDEAAYWRVVETKSGPFFGTALELGAIFGGAPSEVIHEIGKIGILYGEMIQIHDDLNDCMTEPAGPDWLQGRSPLPILFAQTVDHDERDRFLTLRQMVSDREALHDAQSILIRCGAVSYCADQLLHRYDNARQVLEAVEIPRKEILSGLVEEVIRPIRSLLDMVNA